MIRKRELILILLLLVPLTAGCDFSDDAGDAKTKPVRVIEVVSETLPLQIEYIGTIEAEELKKYSFKMSGRVEQVAVQEGQAVKTGEILVRLDTNDLDLAVAAAANSLEQAEKAHAHSRDYYDKLADLFGAGAISKQELDKAGLEKDALEATWNNAKLDYQNKLNVKRDAAITAGSEGIVAAVACKEGEIVAAGYPVVLLRSREIVVTTGISQQDANRVSVGNPAEILVNGSIVQGKVKSISQIPDSSTRTYKVEIDIEEDGVNGAEAENLPLGAVAKAIISIGESTGIFIPIDSIQRGSEDYAFVIADGMAAKRSVTLGEVRGSRVRAEGLNAGDKLVVDGMKRLKEGDRVTIEQ